MGKSTGYTVHLLRVGETVWDADARIIGQTDLPMTESGSDDVVQAVRDFHPEQLLSLALTSQEDSAQRATRLLVSSPEIKIKSVEALANVGLGLWEGVLLTDLEDRCPSAYSQWKDAPERITPPEGESFFDAQERLVTSVMKAMSKAKGPHPTIAIVLRPLAWAIVRCWLREQKICDLWEQLALPIEVETFEVLKSRLESYQRRTKVSA